MRYLGLDVGKRKIGVAVGELLARELTTLRSAKEQDFYSEPGQAKAFAAIKEAFLTEQASAVVVGLPVKQDGSPSEESERISEFATGLQQFLGVEVHKVDETLTSFMAEDMLDAQGASKQEIDERLDQLSAQLILQQYLEENATL